MIMVSRLMKENFKKDIGKEKGQSLIVKGELYVKHIIITIKSKVK